MTPKELQNKMIWQITTFKPLAAAIACVKLAEAYHEEKIKKIDLFNLPSGTSIADVLVRKHSECCGRCINGVDECIYDMDK